MRFERGHVGGITGPDIVGRVAIDAQLCGHRHMTIEDATICTAGGPIVFDFQTKRTILVADDRSGGDPSVLWPGRPE